MASSSNCRAWQVLLGLLLLILNVVACGGSYNNSKLNKTYPYLADITLQSAAAPSIAVAGTVVLRATAGYQVSPNEIDYKDVSSSVNWSTSNSAAATVDQGLVTGTGLGSTTISASLNGKTGRTLVIVGETPTLEITPTGPFSLSANPDQHFKVSASYPDGSELDLTNYATWSSSTAGILKFYLDDPYDYVHDVGEAGLLATGTTTITATVDTGDVASLDVTVIP